MCNMNYKIYMLFFITVQLIVKYGYCSDSTFNVAQAKETYQSSDLNIIYWKSDQAIDGIKFGDIPDNTCSHTSDNDVEPWWAIDLGRMYNIVNISVTTRGDCCGERNTFSIYGTNDNNFHNTTRLQLCANQTNALGLRITKTYICNQQPMMARYVIIKRMQAILTLCEVEIYAECGMCPSKTCKPPNGTCDGPCVTGWTGDGCYDAIPTPAPATTTSSSTKTSSPTTSSTTTHTTSTTMTTTTTKPSSSTHSPSTTSSPTTTATAPTTSTTLTTTTPTTVKSTSSKSTLASSSSTPAPTTLSSITTPVQVSTTTTATKVKPTLMPSTPQKPKPGTATGLGEKPPGEGGTTVIIGATVGAMIVIIAIVVLIVIVLFVRRNKYAKKSTNTADAVQLNEPQRTRPIIAVNPVMSEQQTIINENSATGYSNVGSNSTLVEVANIGAYVANLKEQNKALKDQYESLPNAVYPWDQCDTEDLNIKNRYKNIYPYNNNRVLLKRLGENPLSTYINASFIKDYKGDVSYIAALGPTKFTIDDIWRMVWEQNVHLMVMVTTLVEDQKINCEQYWPAEGMLTYGDIKVALEEETDYYYYIKRLFILSQDNDTRTVVHYQYTAWPDKNIPNHLPSLVKIREIIKTFRESGKSPVVIHCSAGVGRTGTVIALDILLDQASAEGKIDIYKCVEKMRAQRTYLVQALVQYIYLHDALNQIITIGSTVIPCDQLDRVIGSAEYDINLTRQFEFLQSQSPCFNDEDMELGKFQNNDQNRDMNVIPADSLRVKLPSSPETYINGVYVQGFRKNIGSVATQIPLPNTAAVFWEMIYQLKCTTIVCLENSTEEYDKWFQKEESQIVFDNLILTTTNIEVKEIMTKYKITVGKYTESEYANVAHSETVVQDNIEVTIIYLNDWSEKDLSERDITQFLSVLKDVEQNMQGLSTVVCRNGATESGIYLASLWLLQMADEEKEVDVFYAVKQIRKTRPQFIPNKEQYLFLHDVIKSHVCT